MKKILIAEDNPSNFKLFQMQLRDMDVELLHAENGEEAVKLCEANPDISLVLMDIQMPIMNGEDAAIQINKINPNLPIISQTAYSYCGKIEEENKKYFVEFIMKPIDMKYLKELITKYCFDEN